MKRAQLAARNLVEECNSTNIPMAQRLRLLLDHLVVDEFRRAPRGVGLKTAIEARDQGWVDIRMNGYGATYRLTDAGSDARGKRTRSENVRFRTGTLDINSGFGGGRFGDLPMPKYFFHLRELDQLVRDPEGAVFEDLVSARDEACRAIRDIVAEHIAAGVNLRLRTIDICDDKGDHIATVTVPSALRDIIPVSEDMFEVDLANYLDSDAVRCSDIIRH